MSEHVGEHERLGARRSAVLVVQVHDRRHVDGADAWVLSPVVADVDPGDGFARPREHRRRQRARPSGERVHAAVMVGIGMDVEQARVERADQGPDQLHVLPLGDVWDG